MAAARIPSSSPGPGASSGSSPQLVYPTPPQADLPAYSAHRVHALVATLAEDGVASALALADTGLDAARLTDPATRVSYRQIETVLRNAARLSQDPAFALRAGRRMHITAYGMYGYAVLSSPTAAESVAFGLKYHRVAGPVVDMAFSSDGETGVYTYEPLLWPDPTQELYRLAVEFMLASHLTVFQDLRGQRFRPLRIGVVYPAPAHAGSYRQLLQCRVTFGQRANEMVFDAAWIARPMPLADPITYASCREMCEQLLGELSADGSLAAEIRSALIMNPGRFPDAESMAQRLSMHPRALRRRLGTEKTSYRQLLAEVRSRLAIEYLRRTNMTSEEIAARLGYSDAANFRRAFVAWTGKNPTDFRSA